MEGFTYNGIHSSFFHCYYIPDETTKFNQMIDYNIFDSKTDYRDGGIFYGVTAKPREITLDVFYEDITLENFEKMMRWLDFKTKGNLVFDETPWKYYRVHPTKRLKGKDYSSRRHGDANLVYSGTFTITFTAYEPYAFMTMKAYDVIDIDGIGNYCGILPESMMPEAPTTSSRTFLLYNCGTEPTPLTIRIGGSVVGVDGVRIVNDTNGSFCQLKSMPPQGTHLEIDSRSGSVYLVYGSGDKDLAFEYHDSGYITLEPCGGINDSVFVSYTSGSNMITLLNRDIDKSYVGKYLRIDGKWYRIADILTDGIIIDGKPSSTGMEETNIVTMNRIQLYGNGLGLTKLEVDFTPMVQ